MSEDEDAETHIDLELLLSLYSGLGPYLLAQESGTVYRDDMETKFAAVGADHKIIEVFDSAKVCKTFCSDCATIFKKAKPQQIETHGKAKRGDVLYR